MDLGNQEWVAENLQRQRRILEERQRAKRAHAQSAVRSSPLESESFASLSAALVADPTPAPLASLPLNPFVSPNNDYSDRIPSPASSRLITVNTHPTVQEKVPAPRVFEDELLSPEEEEPNCQVVDDAQMKNCEGLEEHVLPPPPSPDFDQIRRDISKFVTEPAQRHVTYRCVITRDKRGVDRGMYPTYFLHLEQDAKSKIFLLAARKRKKSKTANYLLSTDATNMQRASGTYVGKVRSNALGTSFVIFDNGSNPAKRHEKGTPRCEIAAVIYDPNVLGFRGPRKMTIIVPGMESSDGNKPIKIRPISEWDTLFERFKSNKMDEIVKMQNKAPVWSEESQSFVLNFHGRVTQASVKNFQIVHESDEDYVVMQFGRISSEQFSMDYRYPLNAAQAFGIAMTSFHGKIACE